jgi:hypothetical protein
MQVDAGTLPTAFDGAFGDAAHGGDFGGGETAEEFQVDDFSQSRIVGREFVEGVADAREDLGGLDALGVKIKRRVLDPAASLLRQAASQVVDDEAAHHSRGIGHEAGLIGEDGAFAIGYGQIRLV